MAYFVIGDDGQKYGPADVATLNQWIAEGRLLRTQMLEDEASGNRLAASAVAGLSFPAPAAQAAPNAPLPGSPGYQGNYARPGGYVADDGSGDLKMAWIFGVIGLCCCFPFAIAGIVKANQAAAKGHPGATGAKIFTIIVTILSVGGIIFRVILFLKNPSGMLPPTLKTG